MFTKHQQAFYRPLVKSAWLARCARTGVSPDADGAYETWYRRQLLDVCGLYTTKQASRTKDYDKLMAHFGQLAGDPYWTARAAQGDEIRLLYLINQQAERGNISQAYIEGIIRNMGYTQPLQEMPAEHLLKIYNALLRHNKRHTDGPQSKISNPKSEIRSDVPF